ncbi:MAG: hypothetical protein ACE5DO_06625 [Desulfobacterales bacterium]
MLQEQSGSPKFLMLLSLHATLFDPGVPWNLTLSISSVQASGTLKPSPTLLLTYGAVLLWGGTSPLRPIVFPVYASSVLFGSFLVASVSDATLGMGCWLGFAHFGLPALLRGTYKKHQALLGALTYRVLSAVPEALWIKHVERSRCPWMC